MTAVLDAGSLTGVLDGIRRHLEATTADVEPSPHPPDRVTAIEETTDDAERKLGPARATQQALFDAGLAHPSAAPELGGCDADDRAAARIRDAVADADLPDRGVLFVGLHIVAAAVAAHGSADLRRRVLPGLLRGDTVGCQLFSEPGAGSDLASASTRARRDGDDWVISGQKVWTSHAQIADWGEALVRTDTGQKHGGLTMLLVDMHAPGVTVRPLRQITGSAAFNEVFLDDVRVPDGNRIGDVGEGWAIARTSLAAERVMMGTVEGPLTHRLVDRMCALVDRTRAVDDPLLRPRVAAAVAAIAAVTALADREPADWPDDVRGVAGPISKLAMTDALDAVADLASAALGRDATVDTGEPDTFAWSEYLLSTPGLHLAGGTDEIQRSMIAQRGLGLPRDRAH